jgi:uncharacterized delta-60 repeat protein
MRAQRAAKISPGRRLAAGCATFVLMLSASAGVAAAAAPGTLNSGFGTAGRTALPANTRLFAAAAQSNGDVVAVGESGVGSTVHVLVARFTAAGTLDPTFGSGGLVSGPAVAGAQGSLGRAVAIQADGKIVVVGKASSAGGTGEDGLLIERFNTNGSPDASFGSGGVVKLLGSSFGDGYAVAIQSNGDILAGGAEAPSAVPYATVARLDPNGALDSSFGSGGIDELNLGAYSPVQALAIQPNGDIVLAGSQSPGLQATNALIARLKPTGALDTSFAGTGAIAHQYAPAGGAYSSFNAVAVESNGDIVAVGNASAGGETADALAVRFTAAGAADSSFGTAGVALTPSATDWIEENNVVPGADALAIAPNGDIIAAGQYDDSVLTYGSLWAFNSHGQLDTSFGSSGVAVFTDPSAENSEFAGLSISPITGDLITAGDSSEFGGGDYAGVAASYIGYGPPIATLPLKVTLSDVKANYKSATVTFSAACNEACSLSAVLGASAGAAKQLKLGKKVTRCKKVHGKNKCTKVTIYKALTLASEKAKLSAAGSKTFTLRLSKADAKALHKTKSVKLALAVSGTSSSTPKPVKEGKSVTFTK